MRFEAERGATPEFARGGHTRLRPEQWTSGPNLWLIDAVGDPRALAGALKMLAETRFKDTPVRVATRDATGRVEIETLHAVLAAQATPPAAA